jgi:hypothetical protein
MLRGVSAPIVALVGAALWATPAGAANPIGGLEQPTQAATQVATQTVQPVAAAPSSVNAGAATSAAAGASAPATQTLDRASAPVTRTAAGVRRTAERIAGSASTEAARQSLPSITGGGPSAPRPSQVGPGASRQEEPQVIAAARPGGSPGSPKASGWRPIPSGHFRGLPAPRDRPGMGSGVSASTLGPSLLASMLGSIGAVPTPAHESPSAARGIPAAPGPAPAPGLGSGSAGSSAAASTDFLALAGLLLLGAPLAMRRLRLAGEPWRAAPFASIPERPG